MVVYLDAFMGLNFLVDFCLILGVNRLSGHPPGVGRAAAAAALGGIAMSAVSGGGGLALSAGVLALIGRMGLRGQGRRFVTVEVTYGGRTVKLRALVDTGNSLCDPITGEGVTVLSPEIGLRLGLPAEALADPGGVVLPGLRLIPARTVGGGGLLAAVRCEKVVIGGTEAGRLVAFARENFGNGEYQALTGGSYG